MEKITNFALEENCFLANIYPERHPFMYDGIEYHNFETAYQSQKLENELERHKVAKMKPLDAKQYTQNKKMRKHWETPLEEDDERPSDLCTCLKDIIMYELLWIKFHDNEELKSKLLATGDAEIDKENNIGEIYWGTCQGIGQGKIGKMLMEIRERLAQE